MIPQSLAVCQIQSWQQQLKSAFSDAASLLNYLQISPSAVQLSDSAAKDFALRVPLHYAQLMQKQDVDDPLLRQVLNRFEEQLPWAEADDDPLAEASANPVAGLLHKYRNRVLLTLSGACAINCRYCFRRHFAYEDNQFSRERLNQIIAYIEAKPEIDEVILSGGDPLVMPNALLGELLEALNNLTQIKRLRWHTRMPVVIPDRIEQDLLHSFQRFQRQQIMMLHINHPREVSDSLLHAVSALQNYAGQGKGMRIFNQAVLLAGVNDNLETQLALHRQCFDGGVQPYYLNLLDKVSGARHFEVAEERAMVLYQQMQGHLSGYMLPSLIREQAGRASKTRLF